MIYLLILFLFCACKTIVASTDDFESYLGFHDTAAMPFARSDMTATTMNIEGNMARIYIVGGCIQNQMCNFTLSSYCFCPEITNLCSYFVPDTNAWFACSPAPTKRYRHMAANAGGHLVLTGGRDLSDAIITTIDIFDPISDTWSTLPYTWANATSDAVAWAVGSSIYISGGYDKNYKSLATLTALDIAIGEWNFNLAPMEFGRGDTGLAMEGGNFYVLGGWDSVLNPSFCGNASKVVEMYNVQSDTWTRIPDMIYGRGDLAVGVMGGSIFSVAGEIKDQRCVRSVPVPTVGRFAAGFSAWKLEQSIPADLFRFIGASYNGTSSPSSRAIYLFGGQSSFNEACSCYQIKNSTIKYIPASSVHRHKSQVLSTGGLAGIIIASIVVGAAIVLGIASYCFYTSGYMEIKSTDQNADVAGMQAKL